MLNLHNVVRHNLWAVEISLFGKDDIFENKNSKGHMSVLLSTIQKANFFKTVYKH